VSLVPPPSPRFLCSINQTRQRLESSGRGDRKRLISRNLLKPQLGQAPLGRGPAQPLGAGHQAWAWCWYGASSQEQCGGGFPSRSPAPSAGREPSGPAKQALQGSAGRRSAAPPPSGPYKTDRAVAAALGRVALHAG